MGAGKKQKNPKNPRDQKFRMVVITHVGTRALWEEGDDLHRGLAGGVGSVCSHNRRELLFVSSGSKQGISCIKVTPFDCYSKGKEYWLEIMKSYLLIKVSTKPTSHFPRVLQLKGQREY